MPISSLNPMLDHLLESSHRDDSNKWSNIEFGEEITQVESIESNLMNLIWSSAFIFLYELRAPDKVHTFISKMSISSPNTIFDHMIESSH